MSCKVDGAVCERFLDADRCSRSWEIPVNSSDKRRVMVFLGVSLSPDPFPIFPLHVLMLPRPFALLLWQRRIVFSPVSLGGWEDWLNGFWSLVFLAAFSSRTVSRPEGLRAVDHDRYSSVIDDALQWRVYGCTYPLGLSLFEGSNGVAAS